MNAAYGFGSATEDTAMLNLGCTRIWAQAQSSAYPADTSQACFRGPIGEQLERVVVAKGGCSALADWPDFPSVRTRYMRERPVRPARDQSSQGLGHTYPRSPPGLRA